MDIKQKTSAFVSLSIFAIAASWIVYDVYAISAGGTEASISFMMYEWSFKYPIFTLACGFFPGLLMGHFFWRIRDTEGTKILSDNSRNS